MNAVKWEMKPEDTEQRIEVYWDKRSKDFSRLRMQELRGANAEAWQRLIMEYLPEGKRLRILDIGTGAGFFAILMASLGHEVTGIDLSGDMLRATRQNIIAFGCHADFRKMNAQELDFDDESFDAVLSRNLTWTLPDAMQAYREWNRVLKPGGILMNFDSDCGQVQFSRQKEQACVHASLTEDVLEECNDIKAGLRISTYRRPAWDMGFLREIGMEVSCMENIASRVQVDCSLQYDTIPLFSIIGKKSVK